MHKKIFESSLMAGIQLKNRIIRSATYEALGDHEGRPTEALGDLYTGLTKGGVGAIITGYVGVQRNGRTFKNMCMLDADDYIKDYERILAFPKSRGTPVIIQIAHGGGQSNASVTGEEVVAPAEVKYPLHNHVPRALSNAQIEQITDSFIKAIVRAQKAGFDGVQLHAAHGYLLCEFLSPYCNSRTDRWGGSTENRFRIISEIVKGARLEVGNYPIFMKFSAYDGDKHGMTITEAVKIAKLFEDIGGDAIEVSCGGITDGFQAVRFPRTPVEAMVNLMPQFADRPAVLKNAIKVIIPLMIKPRAPLHNYNVPAAIAIKANVRIPVIVVGGLRKLHEMERIILEHHADYVSICRPLIREPDLVNRFLAGKQAESRCIDCGYCLIGATANKVRCYYGKVKGSRPEVNPNGGPQSGRVLQ